MRTRRKGLLATASAIFTVVAVAAGGSAAMAGERHDSNSKGNHHSKEKGNHHSKGKRNGHGHGHGNGSNGNGNGAFTLREPLSGFEETPLAISTAGNGQFFARVDPSAETITYRLSYADLEGDVTMAHIHFGSASQSGGIAAFLCANMTGAPAGTPACPPSPATVTGVIEPEDVVGPADQGIEPGEFDELVAAIRSGTAYVNVHSTLWPSGEIRGQFEAQG
jgi:CHRD domain